MIKGFLKKAAGNEYRHLRDAFMAFYRPWIIRRLRNDRRIASQKDRKYVLRCLADRESGLVLKYFQDELSHKERELSYGNEDAVKAESNKVMYGLFDRQRLIASLVIRIRGYRLAEFGITVSKRYRRMGIGTILADESESLCVRNGLSFFIRIAKENSSSIGFFRSRGYWTYKTEDNLLYMRRARLSLPLIGDGSEDMADKVGKKIWEAEILKDYLSIRRNLFMRPEELKAVQDARLRALVDYAYRKVPSCRERFDKAGVKPESVKAREDLVKIPILHQEEFSRQAFGEKVSKDFHREDVVEEVTGGSSGMRKKIYLSKKGAKMRIAEGYRVMAQQGYNPLDKVAVVQFYPVPHTWVNRLGLLRQVRIPYDLPISEQVKLLMKSGANILEGYPSRFNTLANYIRSERIRIRKPKAIFTNSETLLPHVRNNIREVFGVEPTNVYDCWEFGRIAWECRMHKGLHINADSLIVEIIKDGRQALPGEEGEIVVTDLNNYAMPMIRYAMKDRAVMSSRKCDCGIRFPLLEQVTGRLNDSLILPSGKEISSLSAGGLVIRHEGVLEYQIVQDEIDSIDIFLLVSKKYPKDDDQEIAKDFSSLFGFRKVNIRHVDSIDRTKSMKLRTVICNVGRQG